MISAEHNAPLTAGDARLPAVRARVFALIRSLWNTGVVRVPANDAPLDTPLWPFLPVVWQLLRAELLGRELVEQILPEIARHLHAGGTWQREESRLPARAPVDWSATSQHRTRARPGEPSIVVRRWERAFDLPENQLVVLALEQVLAIIKRIAAPLRAAGVPDALAVADAVREARERPPWVWVETVAEPASVIRRAGERIEQLGAHRPAYARLLDWWQRFVQYRTTVGNGAAVEDPRLEPDRLYELLVLLELVLAFARVAPVYQCRPLGGNGADPTAPLFHIDAEGAPIDIYYQTGSMFSAHRRLKDIWGTPDIVLALSQPARYIVLDAKNYGPANHSDALYKMMGYLYNFGFPNAFERISAGVLAFPTVDREGAGLHAWHPDDTQALFSLVVPPLSEARPAAMSDFVQWVLERARCREG